MSTVRASVERRPSTQHPPWDCSRCTLATVCPKRRGGQPTCSSVFLQPHSGSGEREELGDVPWLTEQTPRAAVHGAAGGGTHTKTAAPTTRTAARVQTPVLENPTAPACASRVANAPGVVAAPSNTAVAWKAVKLGNVCVLGGAACTSTARVPPAPPSTRRLRSAWRTPSQDSLTAGG